MGKLNLSEWHKIPVSLSELCINTTLRCGQSFRWRKSDEGVWSVALHGRVLSLHQDSTHLYYRASFPSANSLPTPPQSTQSSTSPLPSHSSPCDDDTLTLVKHYLNLGPDLSALYASWSLADANFAKRAPRFTGIRILRQDAWEALVGFICSSNNNIARISQMVDKLCRKWGTPLVVDRDPARDEGASSSTAIHLDDDVDSGPSTTTTYYDFPSADRLAADGSAEQTMRELGFGYRARYLAETARVVASRDADWLESLRNPESLPVSPSPSSTSATTKKKPSRSSRSSTTPIKPTAAAEEDNQAWNPTGGRQGYRAAHAALLSLQGVGPKVADCVCLMGLGWGEAVPVDTHVWQIAVRDYRFGKGKHSSLTKATYDAVGDKFRSLWGKEAGWAHSVLFTADLRAFAERLVEKVEVKEEVAVKLEEAVVKNEEEDDDDDDGKGGVEQGGQKEVKVLRKRIKREPDLEEELETTEIIETVRRPRKKRRRN